MKKTKLSLALLLCFISSITSATIYTINAGYPYYSPSSLTINAGDTVEWINDGGNHDVNADINTQTGLSFNNPESFQSSATNIVGAIIYTHIFTIPGDYSYDCSISTHAADGMVGSISVNDCNGVFGGTSLIDTCGVCIQASIYNFVTHVATSVDNANILIAGVDYDPSTEVIVMADNPNNPLWNTSCVTSNSIYDIVSNSPDHIYLEICIDTCSLDATLSAPGSLTLFAPTDAAFMILPPNTVASLLNNLPLLTDILKHHVVANTVMSSALSNNMIITTLLGTDVTATLSNGNIYIDNAMITTTDIVADNGVVHIIDAILLPPIDCNEIVNGTSMEDSCGVCHQAYIYNSVTHAVTFLEDTIGVTLTANDMLIMPNHPMNPYWINDPALCGSTVYDIVSGSDDHTILEAAIDACGLDDYLSDSGPFTLFAPTDAAFNALPTGTVTDLLNNIPELTDILKHHVIGDSVMAGMLSNNMIITTLLGTDVTVTISNGNIYIENAMITTADIVADNGVVHIIDAVLLPTNTSIENYDDLKKTYLYSVDVMGKRTNRNTKNQIIFDIYSDGSVVKLFNK